MEEQKQADINKASQVTAVEEAKRRRQLRELEQEAAADKKDLEEKQKAKELLEEQKAAADRCEYVKATQEAEAEFTEKMGLWKKTCWSLTMEAVSNFFEEKITVAYFDECVFSLKL